MIDILSRSSSLLSACQFSNNTRNQAFINADQMQYTTNTEMQFSVPSKEILDMTESYIDFDVSINNGIIETPEIYELRIPVLAAGTPINAGRFNFILNGELSDRLDFNATALQVYNALISMKNIGGKGYVVNVQNIPADPNIVNGFNIRLASFDICGKLPSEWGGPLGLTNVSVRYSAAAPFGNINAPGVIELNQTQFGALSTPRVERFLPLFDYIHMQLNNETIINITDCNILGTLLSMINNEFYVLGDSYGGAQQENGLGFYRTWYDLGVGGDTTLRGGPITRQLYYSLDKIDIFKKILPLELFQNAQFRMYMHIDLANKVLICSTETNTANQSITITNPKLHYHKLLLPESEKAKLIAMKNSEEGLIIPFTNWHNYHEEIAQGSSNKSFIFNPSQSALLGVFFVMWGVTYASDARNVRKFSTFLKNNISTYRLKVGSQYFPLDAVRSDPNNVSFAEMAAELFNFAELVEQRRLDGDTFALGVYSIASPSTNAFPSRQGVDPTLTSYVPWFDDRLHQSTIMAIGTSDIGYAENSQLCVRAALNGIDTKALANVQLELNGMTVAQPCQCDIFYLSQDYLIFKGDEFKWRH